MPRVELIVAIVTIPRSHESGPGCESYGSKTNRVHLMALFRPWVRYCSTGGRRCGSEPLKPKWTFLYL